MFVDTRFPASPGPHLFSSSSTSGLQPSQTSRRTEHTLQFLNPPPFHTTSTLRTHSLTARRHPHIHDLAFCILFPCHVFFLRILPGAYIPQSSQSYSYPALKRLPPGPAPGQRRPEDIDKHIIEHRHRKIPMLERPATGALSRPGRLQAPESTLRRSLPHSPRLESKDTHDCTRTSGLYDRGISADTHRVFRPKAHWQND